MTMIIMDIQTRSKVQAKYLKWRIQYEELAESCRREILCVKSDHIAF